MDSQSRRISIKAKKICCWPKKITDQPILSKSWMPNIIKANFLVRLCRAFLFWLMIKNRARPIKIYSTVQAGPKSQFGGVKSGLFKVAYQPLMWGLVKMEPMKPAKRQMPSEASNLINLIIICNYLIIGLVVILSFFTHLYKTMVLFYTDSMKFFNQYKKVIAAHILSLMFVGMFCIGMFAPMTKARAAESAKFRHGCQIASHQTELHNQLADCCLNRPHQYQAIIIDKQNVSGSYWCSALMPDDFSPCFKKAAPSLLDTWPPPAIELLRSVIKKE